ncbi:MAG: hypothetical protein MPW14_19195 [Candidatus Manganitrophus sp.]|nr:hypothetical protein [Candidatus Manganitrophus sp.]MDC4225428.1 hypothetical protein [Candidatus Manganitrophus sp.]WDT73201.1 MAG: hypothetical protein MPW17_10260 [Candidatus Manganitrophus sp.]WDT74600.1 MAG: hypothetical protein MPW16_15215 [Candidatus Manganitrophus sp.]WDT79252.1 MAG: hypothetical protein MPW14_19195 [Candidatus Manganitrophus sp.]
MKKTTLVAAMGLALVLGTAMESKAICLFGCDDSKEVNQTVKAAGRDIREQSDNVGGDQAKGIGNQVIKDIKDSAVVTGNKTFQSNSVGHVVGNSGDIAQSNSANITGKTEINNSDLSTTNVNSNNK